MNKQFSGYVMAFIGFAFLLVNAYAYIFNAEPKSPALVVMGLVFVVVGFRIAKETKKERAGEK